MDYEVLENGTILFLSFSYWFLEVGEINRFLHIHWNSEYASKVDNYIAYKFVFVSKFCIVLIVLLVAYCDPSILKCDNFKSYVCNRKETAFYGFISMGISIFIMISVSIYFGRKVYLLSKVHPSPDVEDPERNKIENLAQVYSIKAAEEVNGNEDNVVRRLNQNPYQFFRVKISKAFESFPSSQETFPMITMVKKALIVNLVSFCQIAFLFPLYVIDIILLLKISQCDDQRFSNLSISLGAFGLLFNICFPILLEKKLDRFCLQL